MIGKILNYISVLMLLVPTCGAVTEEEERQTPGKILSQMQAETYQLGKFVEALGQEEVDKLGMNWGVLSDVQLSPMHPVKLETTSRLVKKFRLLSRNEVKGPVRNLFRDLLELKDECEQVHVKRLDKVVVAYFRELFKDPVADAEFQERSNVNDSQGSGSDSDVPEWPIITSQSKTNGVQLGEIVTIETRDGQVHKFFVKTHSEGTLAEKSTAAKQVHPGELLVYKIMEELGIGPEVHICARSPEDVYIASRDAHDGGVFHLFKEATRDEKGIGAALWGGLGKYKLSPRSGNREAIEEGLSEDPVANNFVEQIALLDLLTRIARLCDFLNNPENFGFSKQGCGAWKVRPLDFRLQDELKPEDKKDIFQSFLSGNGVFKYWTSHRSLCFSVYDRSRESRVKSALHILTQGALKDFSSFEEVEGGHVGVLRRAYLSVQEFLQQECFHDVQEELNGKLDAYYELCHGNYAYLLTCLQSWEPQLQVSQE